MLAIRLRRAGAKKDPHYRIVVTDRAAGRDGPFLEILGHYHPRRNPVEVVFHQERIDSWVAQGAQMSDTVRSLYRKRPTTGAAAPAAVVDVAAVEAEAAETGAAEVAPDAEVAAAGDDEAAKAD